MISNALSRYCVPGKYKEEFDKAIKSHYSNLFAKNPNAIYTICLMMNPLELRKRKVKLQSARLHFLNDLLSYIDPGLSS